MSTVDECDNYAPKCLISLDYGLTSSSESVRFTRITTFALQILAVFFLCLFAAYNTYAFIIKKRKYKNTQLLLVYIFSDLTLVARLAFYLICLVQALTPSIKQFGIATWIFSIDLPDYTYLLTGAA